jgi:ATP-dependent Lhr-like helicase
VSGTAFEKLHPALQYHVVNSLEWRTLRPVQLASIEPILDGKDCLILAPTAGGKTEAAIIPVLSRMLAAEWKGLSVIYVCPLKALLNNLEERLSRYTALVGRVVQVWHGDINQSAKANALRAPPDILLTTPESLEGMLISLKVDRANWFSSLRVVIVDELHAFAGDDRGWHLRAVLGRLQDYALATVQRIGLSATLGNPVELLRWFSRSDDGCVVGDPATPTDSNVTVDFVGNMDNAAMVIARLHRGTKRLVFCDSRAGVEKIATDLRGRGVRTFVSHSSLSASERKHAEGAFSQETDCVIVATSTLELGIDVGDLDYVIQIDAPSTVSSFLQRMGRSGRRAGSNRNYLFLTTTDESFLVACGIVRLWKEGYVEPVIPPPEPWHLIAQQAMAFVLQTKGVGLDECVRKLEELFPELSESGIRAVVAHMCSSGILSVNDALLGFGERGEKLYGRQHFLDLLSSFASQMQLLVRHGFNELGYIDPITVQGTKGEDHIILLAGHSWKVTSVDWTKRTVWVEPIRGHGKASWFGTGRSLAYEVCQAIKRVLCDTAMGAALSKRGVEKLHSLRDELPVFDPAGTTVERLEKGRTRWWTFAGAKANWVLAHAIQMRGSNMRIDDFYVEMKGIIPIAAIRERLQTVEFEGLSKNLISSKAVDLKFRDAVPDNLLCSIVNSRVIDQESAERVSTQPVSGLARNDS